MMRLELRSDGMEFASEMIMTVSELSLEIAEEPITYHERAGEAKLDSYRDGWRHVRFMTLNAPGYLFSVPGMLFCVAGVILLSASFVEPTIGEIQLGPGAAIAGGLLLITGYQVASLTVFSIFVGHPIQEVRDPITTWVADNLTLERGMTVGLMLFVAGVAVLLVLLFDWTFGIVPVGGVEIPTIRSSVVALTVIIIGLQTVFYSFFLTYIEEL